MKLKFLIVSLVISFTFASCIREEAPNAEADILTCTVPKEILKKAPIISNNKVIIMAKKANTDIQHLAPEFTLTPGATIDPPSGRPRDFSRPQFYTVISEDGHWKKQYEVKVDTSLIKTKYSFEHWTVFETPLGKRYYEFYEVTNEGQKQDIWATANAGYAITGKHTDENKYPTISYDQGIMGKAVKLETKSTGAFGSMVGMPIAAGNLFIGIFNAENAAKSPEEALKATQFGLPMALEFAPVSFDVWYKFTPGEKFTDESMNILDRTDTFDMYAIIYEPINGRVLDGSIQFDDECIVGIARIADPQPTKEYIHKSIPFEYRKEVDLEKLKNSEYYLAIVFSSSLEGAYFRGAVGSTLIIDEVELVF